MLFFLFFTSVYASYYLHLIYILMYALDDNVICNYFLINAFHMHFTKFNNNLETNLSVIKKVWKMR